MNLTQQQNIIPIFVLILAAALAACLQGMGLTDLPRCAARSRGWREYE